MNQPPLTDSVWDSFQQGSESAFRALYLTHYKLLVNYGRRFGAPDDQIEDTIHDLFLELWHYRTTLTRPQSVPFYLLKSFRNRLLTSLARRNRFQTSDDDCFGLLPAEPSAEERLLQAGLDQQQQERIQQALAQLSPRQQEIIYLRYFSDLDYEQICTVMGITYHTARTQMYQALTRLRKQLQAHWPACIALFLTAS